MALQTLNTIKEWFKTGLKPTQSQFWDTWDSFRHKYDKVPVQDVEGLDNLLLAKADKTALNDHLADKNAHALQVNTDWNSESGISQLINKPEFKTINGEPLTGVGDIVIEAGGAQNLQTTLGNGNETTNSIMFNDDYYNWLKTSIDSRSIRLTDSNSDMLVAIDSAGVVTRDDSQHVSLNPQGIFFNRDTVESYLRINTSSTGVSTVNLPVTKGTEITLAATDDFKTINGESIVGEGNLVIAIEPQGLKSILDTDPTASYGESKATLMGDYGNSKYNEIIVSDETEKTSIYQLKNQLSFDHTLLNSNDIGNITLSEGNIILTRDKSNNQTVVDISDPVANTQLRFPAKSEEGKTYTIATTDDFKTINGESIVGSGDILINGGVGDIPTLQEVLNKDRNATNTSINLLSEDGEFQTTVYDGGLNVSAKTETGFLITDINKLGVSVSKDQETTFTNVLADELSLNKHISGNPVKQGIVLNEDSSGASTIKLPLTSNGDAKTLASTSDFKTINGESIIGEGDITVSGSSQTLDQVLAAGSIAYDKNLVLSSKGAYVGLSFGSYNSSENPNLTTTASLTMLNSNEDFSPKGGSILSLNPESTGFSKFTFKEHQGDRDFILATTEDFKTINGQSIVGEGDFTITAAIPDGAMKVAGGLALDGTFRNLTDNLGNPTRLWINNMSITSVGGDNTLNNVAFGPSALRSVSSGIENTAFGTATLSANTSGNQNTAIGYSSLRDNTTGYYNTAVGCYSLLVSTEGTNNVAFGHAAMYQNKSGDNNVALGYSSLSGNISGNNNIAIGYAALNSSQSSSNLAIGTRAMVYTVNGDTNIAIGEESLQYNVGGSSNVAIGFQALKNTTSGSGNIALGLYAGKYISDSNTSHTSSYSSIFLGSGTMPLKNGGSNEIVIGDFAAGSGDNSVTLGNNNITKTILRGAVSAKSYKLESLNTAPANSSDTGNTGEIRVTTDYIYVCTSTNTWVRTALTSW